MSPHCRSPRIWRLGYSLGYYYRWTPHLSCYPLCFCYFRYPLLATPLLLLLLLMLMLLALGHRCWGSPHHRHRDSLGRQDSRFRCCHYHFRCCYCGLRESGNVNGSGSESGSGNGRVGVR